MNLKSFKLVRIYIIDFINKFIIIKIKNNFIQFIYKYL